MKKPLVSILIVTYNHSNYIKKALESVLMQKVNFEYKIIIADDFSTDNTLAIIHSIKDKTDINIEIIINNKNKGVLENAKNFITAVKSKYFALLDGDDYWNYEYKLQRQIDFLEKNNEYSGVYHDTQIEHYQGADNILFKGNSKYSDIHKFKENTYPWDILNRLVIPSSAILLKSSCIHDPSFDLINDNFSVKWKLTCLAIKSSKFYYINELWSVYRNHPKGISKSNTIKFHFSHINFLKTLVKDDYYRNIPFEVYDAISSEYKILLYKIYEEKNTSLIKNTYWKYLKNEVKKHLAFYKKLKK